MTVQELIEELQKVEDKTLPIVMGGGTECEIDIVTRLDVSGVELTHWIAPDNKVDKTPSKPHSRGVWA